MKVLFVSDMPVNKSVSSGNTFLNFFSGVDEVEKYSIQTRGGLPDESIKRTFFINEKQIVSKIFKWTTPVGKEIKERYTGKTYSESKTIKAVLRKDGRFFSLFKTLFGVYRFGNQKG